MELIKAGYHVESANNLKRDFLSETSTMGPEGISQSLPQSGSESSRFSSTDNFKGIAISSGASGFS